VYAFLDEAKDYKLDRFIWFGWTDVHAPGTPILQPMAYKPVGEMVSSTGAKALRQLGRGRVPNKE